MARRKGKKSRRSKKSAFGMMKGVLYVGSVAAPMYMAYNQLGGGAKGAQGVMQAAAFMNQNNQFSLDHGKQIWAPVAALAIVDLVSSKVGIQRRIATGMSKMLR